MSTNEDVILEGYMRDGNTKIPLLLMLSLQIAKADQEASWERQASAAAREETASLRASLAEVQGELQEALQREEELAQWIDEIEASGWEHEQVQRRGSVREMGEGAFRSDVVVQNVSL